MNCKHITASLSLLALVGATLVGCNDNTQPPYGGKPSSAVTTDTGMNMSPPPLVVPAGATPLASGTFNQIQFKVPNEGGVLYIYDQETKKVYMTNSIASDGGKSMSMPDLGHTVSGLSNTDSYRIYFAPNAPTTAPIGGM